MKKKPNSKVRTVRLKVDVIKKVKLMALKQNRTFTNMVETILIEYFKNENA